MTDYESESQDRDEKPTETLPVQVPQEALSKDTLTALIEAFILREGTDYGASEVSLETKISQVRKQIEKDDIVIVYDLNSESVNLLTKNEWTKLSRASLR